ncbi:MAG: hypothetical protein RBS17_01520 [Coriobacteriia bacterium]|jgi:hypothetical protein|nr:hypothetical protein [Coriobacteriia bacterium]
MRLTNELVLTLAAAYTHGTSEYLEVAEDLSAMILAGEIMTSGIVRVFDDEEWVLLKYGGVDEENNRLTNLSPAAPRNASDGADDHVFAIGSSVWGPQAADYVNEVADAIPAFATPAIALGTSAAAGNAATVIRSNATIVAFDATAPSTQAFGDSPSAGEASVAARRDHKHGMPSLNDDQIRKITVSTDAPSGGSDGDLWFKYA